MTTYNYQCSRRACGRKRRTLPKRKELYVKEPVCLDCGTTTLVHRKTDKARNKKRTCWLDCMSFPHSKATVWCICNDRVPSDLDYLNRYGFVPEF